MTPDPVPRSLVAVDIEGYGRRGDLEHVDLRKALRDVCGDAFAQIGAADAHGADRGDALLYAVGPQISKPRLVDDLVRELDTALRRWNSSRLPQFRMRLRMALHSGEVLIDGNGLSGEGLAGGAPVVLMRLLDAHQLRQALKTAPHDLAVIVSDRMHHDAVAQGHRGIDSAEFRQVQISVKELSQSAWIRVPGLPVRDEGPEQPTSPRPAAPEPSASAAGAVHFTGPATFHGPTSFGSGHAIGGGVNVAGRDIYAADRDMWAGGANQDD